MKLYSSIFIFFMFFSHTILANPFFSRLGSLARIFAKEGSGYVEAGAERVTKVVSATKDGVNAFTSKLSASKIEPVPPVEARQPSNPIIINTKKNRPLDPALLDLADKIAANGGSLTINQFDVRTMKGGNLGCSRNYQSAQTRTTVTDSSQNKDNSYKPTDNSDHSTKSTTIQETNQHDSQRLIGAGIVGVLLGGFAVKKFMQSDAKQSN